VSRRVARTAHERGVRAGDTPWPDAGGRVPDQVLRWPAGIRLYV